MHHNSVKLDELFQNINICNLIFLYLLLCGLVWALAKNKLWAGGEAGGGRDSGQTAVGGIQKPCATERGLGSKLTPLIFERRISYWWCCVYVYYKVEISHLKARQSGLQEEVQKLHHSAQAAANSSSSNAAVLPAATSATSSSFQHRSTAAHQGFHGDEVDLSDVLWSQQEINRLSNEVHHLEAEVAHWRRVAQVNFNFTIIS